MLHVDFPRIRHAGGNTVQPQKRQTNLILDGIGARYRDLEQINPFPNPG